jgi:hypothetical protein
VVLGVGLGCFAGVMSRVKSMAVSAVSVVCCLFVSAVVMMARGFVVMPGRVFMVLRRFPMVFCCHFRHIYLLVFSGIGLKSHPSVTTLFKQHET